MTWLRFNRAVTVFVWAVLLPCAFVVFVVASILLVVKLRAGAP